MLADPTGALCRGFGTHIEDEGVSLRGTFLIDPEGIVQVMEVHSNSIGRSAGETVRKLVAAVHVATAEGEVCPAGWEPGAETLLPSLELVRQL